MALTDAYAAATRLGREPPSAWPKALRDYDTARRRDGVNAVVWNARMYTWLGTSPNWFACGALRVLGTHAPTALCVRDFLLADFSNRDTLRELTEGYGLRHVGDVRELDSDDSFLGEATLSTLVPLGIGLSAVALVVTGAAYRYASALHS